VLSEGNEQSTTQATWCLLRLRVHGSEQTVGDGTALSIEVNEAGGFDPTPRCRNRPCGAEGSPPPARSVIELSSNAVAHRSGSRRCWNRTLWVALGSGVRRRRQGRLAAATGRRLEQQPADRLAGGCSVIERARGGRCERCSDSSRATTSSSAVSAVAHARDPGVSVARTPALIQSFRLGSVVALVEEFRIRAQMQR
jgi:hypothetical protein